MSEVKPKRKFYAVESMQGNFEMIQSPNRIETLKQARAYFHPMRQVILRAIPVGSKVTEASLAKATGLPLRQVIKHIRILKAAGIVRSNNSGLVQASSAGWMFDDHSPKGTMRIFRRYTLSHMLLTHKAGLRILERSPERFFSNLNFAFSATSTDLAALRHDILNILLAFAQKHPPVTDFSAGSQCAFVAAFVPC